MHQQFLAQVVLPYFVCISKVCRLDRVNKIHRYIIGPDCIVFLKLKKRLLVKKKKQCAVVLNTVYKKLFLHYFYEVNVVIARSTKLRCLHNSDN